MGGNRGWCSSLVFCCCDSLENWRFLIVWVVKVVKVRAGANSSHNLALRDEVMSMQ